MSDEYQLRRDITRFNLFLNNLESTLRYEYGLSINEINELLTLFNDKVFQKLGLDQPSAEKFNFAIISELEDEEVINEEFWILSNAYYNYALDRFIKIDPDNTSFGIQIQASGNYPGESELGYFGNTGINIWRNPTVDGFKREFPYWATDNTYDFTGFVENNIIGAEVRADGSWKEFGLMCGWNNAFMLDSYGGMTIGGAGLEVDGNGIFPYARLTSSRYFDGLNTYYLLGLLDNAYHPTLDNWECDSNSTYSWFVGLRTLESSNMVKDNTNASFVVMYNDTPYNEDNTHELDATRWHIVFQVNTNGVI